MSKELPYFRWFPKDAESDARYAAMSLAELGLYHRCMNHAWMNDGLPSDNAEVARELRIPLREFMRHWPRVSSCFQGQERLRNPRQEVERNHARTKSVQATEAIRARHARSAEDRTDESTNEDTDVDSSVPPRAYGSGSKVLSSTLETTEKKSCSRAESESWFNVEFWPLWPVKIGKEPAKRACLKIKPEDRGEVIRAVREHTARIESMERPIHPATWLNDRRWEDDPQAVNRAVERSTGLLPFMDRNQVRRAETLSMVGMLRRAN